MRLTPHRKTILSLLEDVKQPLSAEMIMQKLPDNTMDLSTIYRTLEKLYLYEMISKSMIHHTAYYHLNQKNHHHYMICLHCKKMFELDCHMHDMIEDIENKTKYKIVQHDVTFYGYCDSCRKELNL